MSEVNDGMPNLICKSLWSTCYLWWGIVSEEENDNAFSSSLRTSGVLICCRILIDKNEEWFFQFLCMNCWSTHWFWWSILGDRDWMNDEVSNKSVRTSGVHVICDDGDWMNDNFCDSPVKTSGLHMRYCNWWRQMMMFWAHLQVYPLD